MKIFTYRTDCHHSVLITFLANQSSILPKVLIKLRHLSSSNIMFQVFRAQTALVVILVFFIGVIYCSPESESCCGGVFKEESQKETCSKKIDEELTNGILPKENHKDLLTKACKAVTAIKQTYKLSPAEFGFLAALGKEQEQFYKDFIHCFPAQEADDIFFFLTKNEGLKRHNVFDLHKAMTSGGAKWWTHLNTHDEEYLNILKDDRDGNFKTIALNEKFQEFYYNYKKWVTAGEAVDCHISYIFGAYILNPELFRRPIEEYKDDVIMGERYLCAAENAGKSLSLKTLSGKQNVKPIEENKGVTKKQEQPIMEPAKTEQPKVELPKVEPPKVEPPKVEPPKKVVISKV